MQIDPALCFSPPLCANPADIDPSCTAEQLGSESRGQAGREEALRCSQYTQDVRAPGFVREQHNGSRSNNSYWYLPTHLVSVVFLKNVICIDEEPCVNYLLKLSAFTCFVWTSSCISHEYHFSRNRSSFSRCVPVGRRMVTEQILLPAGTELSVVSRTAPAPQLLWNI